MPVGAFFALSGRGRAAPDRPPVAAFSGWLSNGRSNPPTLTGTVTAQTRRSFDGADDSAMPGTIYTGVRVELAGQDVTAHLVGAVEVSDSIDTHLKEARFTVEGSRFSPTATETTWTRSTACKVWFRQGPPGEVQEVLELNGFVETCNDAGDGAFEIRAVDAGIRFNDTPVCVQIAPHAGLTTGDLCRQLAQAAGIAETDIPDGGPWARPFESAGRRLYELLRAVGEPKGWHWRTTSDGVLEAYVPELKREPEAPDHAWSIDELLEHPSLEPPRDVPSRWVLRGARAVLIDELGLATEVFEVEVKDVYRPKVATLLQQTDGTTTPLNIESIEAERVVSRLVDQVTRRGGTAGRVERQTTVEHGWINLAKGKWSTDGPEGLGHGPVGEEGYYYKRAFIDEDGTYRIWERERFLEVGRRDQDFTYDEESNLIGLTVTTRSRTRRRRAVRSNASEVANVSGTDIGDDDLSYARQDLDSIEAMGVESIQQATYTYDRVNGPLVLEVLEILTPMSPRATIDPAEPYFILSDGTGQEEREARLQRSHRLERQHLIDGSGRLRGTLDREFQYQLTAVVGGAFDFGDFAANVRVAPFVQLPITGTEIRVINDESYVEVTYADGRRTEVRRLGQPPLPAYLSSPWTRLVLEPLEAVLEDPVLEAWFGYSSRVKQSEYAQSSLELHQMIERDLARLLAHKLRVRRADTGARPGDTVFLTDPLLTLAHRCRIVERKRRRVPLTGEATAEYRLEAPLS